MSRFNTVLFDLDGTLTDSSPGILNCVRYTLTEMGRDIPDDSVLNKFLGPPLRYAFTEFCGFDETTAEEAFRLYRQRYKEICAIENALYDGVYEMLKRLHGAGKTLAVATNKAEFMAEKIVGHFGIRPFFTAVCGAAPDGSDGKKSDVIKKALRLCGEDDLKSAVMVGDRFYDIEGAREVGIESIGALFGYGEREELENAGADFIASSPDEIVNIILK